MEKPNKPISLKFLAEQLGLSQGTVSMALSPESEKTGVAFKTRERVLKAAAAYNYRPNHHARSLSSGRSHTIGVIVPAISEGYYATLLSSIESHLLESDYFFFVTSHRWNRALLESLPQTLMSRGAEGLILINTVFDQELALPSVRIGGNKPHEHSTNVCLNESRGTRLALEHLHALGHRHIAFIRGEQESTATAERWAGIKKNAQKLGLKVNSELVVQLELSDQRGSARYGYVGYRAAQTLLASKRPFTALFAYNDSTAIGAMRAFQEAGMRVPEDISIVGYDDIPAAQYERPSLTTVRQPLDVIGATAAKVLLETIGGKRQPARILVEPELALRNSSGPAPTAMGASKPSPVKKSSLKAE